MIKLLQKEKVLSKIPINRLTHEDDKILIFTKDDLVFVFNFHPAKSFEGYFVPSSSAGKYKVILTSDQSDFGGYSRVDTDYVYNTFENENGVTGFKFYLPNRVCTVFKKQK